MTDRIPGCFDRTEMQKQLVRRGYRKVSDGDIFDPTVVEMWQLSVYTETPTVHVNVAYHEVWSQRECKSASLAMTSYGESIGDAPASKVTFYNIMEDDYEKLDALQKRIIKAINAMTETP